MEIGQEIKQEKFKSEYQKLMINILFTSNWLTLKNSQLLKPYGITQEQFNILRILRGQFPKTSSIQLLVDRMLNKSSNASRIVDKLKLKQLVTRQECQTDRRLVEILITPKGQDLLSKIDIELPVIEYSFKHISEDDAKAANKILDAIRA